MPRGVPQDCFSRGRRREEIRRPSFCRHSDSCSRRCGFSVLQAWRARI